MDRIQHGRKNAVRAQKISSKYHQLIKSVIPYKFQLVVWNN